MNPCKIVSTTVVVITLLLSPFYSANARDARPDLTVMTYNMMQLISVSGDWDQTQRMDQAVPILKKLATSTDSPDIIVFTEIFTNYAYQQLDQLSHTYPYKTPVVGLDCSGAGWSASSGNCSNGGVIIRGGVFIMSKWPIEYQSQHIYHASHIDTWDYWSNKGFAYTKINKQGYRYHVIGTHMQADESNDPQTETHNIRMSQLSEIRHFVDNSSIPADEPVIVTGDMNVEYKKADNVSTMLQRLNARMDFNNDQGFGSFSASDNWHARANAYYYEYSLSYDDTLDYVLTLNDHLQPKQAANMRILPLKTPSAIYWSYLKGWWKLPGQGDYWHNGYYQDISDHYPVTATFRY